MERLYKWLRYRSFGGMCVSNVRQAASAQDCEVILLNLPASLQCQMIWINIGNTAHSWWRASRERGKGFTLNPDCRPLQASLRDTLES